MKKIYVTEKQAKKYPKTKTYPNKYVFESNDLHVIVIPDGTVVKFLELNEKQCQWYGVPNGSVQVCFDDMWKPKDLYCGTLQFKIMGETRGVYSDKTDLAKKYGYIQGNSSLGSSTDCFDGTKIELLKKLLRKNNFTIEQ